MKKQKRRKNTKQQNLVISGQEETKLKEIRIETALMLDRLSMAVNGFLGNGKTSTKDKTLNKK